MEDFNKQNKEEEKAKEDDNGFVSLRDLEERNIDIKKKVEPFESLLLVAEVAGQKLEEEERNYKKGKRVKVVESSSDEKKPMVTSSGILFNPTVHSKGRSSRVNVNALKRKFTRPRCGMDHMAISECRTNREDLVGGLGSHLCGKSYHVPIQKPKPKPPLPPPPLPPAALQRKVEMMGGEGLSLVIEKRLTVTDMKNDQGRLSIPKAQVRNPGFLNAEEERMLSRREWIEVKIIEPSLAVGEITLKQWNLNSCCYVLGTKWNDLRDRNNLQEGDLVQLWAFRVQHELHFAIW